MSEVAERNLRDTFAAVSGPGSRRESISSLIAESLDAAYVESGLTQQQVATATGISQSQVSKYLRGVRVPDLDTLAALCEALGLDMPTVVRDALERRG